MHCCQLLRHFCETLTDVGPGFGAHIEQLHILLFAKALHLTLVKLLLIVAIWLVAQQINNSVVLRVLHHLRLPQSYFFIPKLFDVREGLLYGHIVGHEYSMCALVVGWSDCPESLLACGVPDLQFYDGTIRHGDWPKTMKRLYLNRKSTPMVAR